MKEKKSNVNFSDSDTWVSKYLYPKLLELNSKTIYLHKFFYNFDFTTNCVIDQMWFPFTKKERSLKISYRLLVIKHIVESNILMKKVRINQEHMDYIYFQMPIFLKRL